MAASSSRATGGSKPCRSYGGLGNDSVAASLFDAAFSKTNKSRCARLDLSSASRSQDSSALPNVSESAGGGGKRRSPHQVFSPPISLPESTSSTEQVNEEAVSNEFYNQSKKDAETEIECGSSDEDAEGSRRLVASQDSLSVSLGRANILSSPAKQRPAPELDEDDDLTPPLPKKSKSAETPRKEVERVKIKPVYRHKWTEDDDEEEEATEGCQADKLNETLRLTSAPAKFNSAPSVLSSSQGQPLRGSSCLVRGVAKSGVPGSSREFPASSWRGGHKVMGTSRIRNVKEAHQCLESGEHFDYLADLEYDLSTLTSNGSTNVKCLSCTSLARKCVSSQFRHFIRSQNEMGALLKALQESPSHPKFALSAAAILYLMCRDSVSVSLDSTAVRLFSQLLRIENVKGDEDFDKHLDTVWNIFSSYLDTMESAGKKISFDMKKDELSASSLILEALVYVLKNSKEAELKTELLNLGILQWVVARVDSLVNELATEEKDDEKCIRILVPLERSLRILEESTTHHKKNQAFLISHRSSMLINSCSRLLTLVHSRVGGASESCPSSPSLANPLMHSLALTARVLTNLSCENELCCTKLGQTPDFLLLCLSSSTFLAQKFAEDEQRYDLTAMMISLVVNLVERCNANRKKLIENKVRIWSREEQKEEQLPSLVALTKMFVEHEKSARESDETLDQELCIEEPPDEREEDIGDDDIREDGRLERGLLGEMTEGELLVQLRSVINKASAHMEVSVIAAYLALLVGCVLQQNEESSSAVKELLPKGKMIVMTEQLKRYLDFLQLSGVTATQFRTIEKIVDFMERLDT